MLLLKQFMGVIFTEHVEEAILLSRVTIKMFWLVLAVVVLFTEGRDLRDENPLAPKQPQVIRVNCFSFEPNDNYTLPLKS